jgi:glyoxylase-like metal-dependent hydrolase (beta-lactamase superfamily II)
LKTDEEEAMSRLTVQHFYDEPTGTLTYVVHDDATKIGAVIDSLTDYDPKSARTTLGACERVRRYVDDRGLRIPYVLDTHAHADRLTGIPFFEQGYGAASVIGWKITEVQATFRRIFNLGDDFPVDGSQFGLLLHDGETLRVGPITIEGLYTPGHTPACMTYRIEDMLFVGDVLFMPDFGVARCDFPGGSAEALYDSVMRLHALPDETRVFTGHDYRVGGRPLRFESTIGEQKRSNVLLNATTKKEDFVALRKRRDAGLDMPVLILPAVQINIRAGRLPQPEPNGVSYLKIPVNAL